MAGNLTWLGDSDPEAVVIEQHGVTFVKGEAVAVKDKEVFERLSRNPMFSSEKNAEPAQADEPDPVDPDAGTEKAALREALRLRGVSVQGNASVDTLRAKLAEASK